VPLTDPQGDGVSQWIQHDAEQPDSICLIMLTMVMMSKMELVLAFNVDVHRIPPTTPAPKLLML